MKPGTRALGVAVSGGDDRATVGGAVVRRDRVTDGFALADCTVGGLDATAAVRDLLATLDREDCQYLLVAGVAPAWFNLVDLHAVHETFGRPALAVSFEDSPGLTEAIRREFDGAAARRRLAVYRRLPDRQEVRLGGPADGRSGGDGDSADSSDGGRDANATDAGRSVWVRAVGCSPDRAREIVRAYTPEGSGRPEPVRVARLVARAGRTYRD